MTIDINELRSDANTAHFGHMPLEIPGRDLLELLDRLEAAEKEREALRAKIEQMEKQEPVATVIKEGDSRYWMSERLWTFPDGKYPLYALPGAQPAPRIPDDVMRDAKRYRFLRAAKNIPISTEAARDPIVYDAAIDAAMLAAAQEAKP